MLAGDVKTAERMLRFFHEHAPRTPEVPNNLSLALLQDGHDREALDLLEASVEQFPRFRPLFANAVPGVWINDSAIGELDSRIYVHGFSTIWLPIIHRIRPPKIYLCGGWAKGIAKILRGELCYRARVEVKCHPIAWGKGGGWDQANGPRNLGEECGRPDNYGQHHFER